MYTDSMDTFDHPVHVGTLVGGIVGGTSQPRVLQVLTSPHPLTYPPSLQIVVVSVS